MAYNNPSTRTYSLGELDIGAGGDTFVIPNPGMKGIVKDIVVSATEGFTNDTTPAYIRLGDGSDADKFAELDMGTTADGAGLAASGQDGAITGVDIDTDEDLTITTVAPTGGTPAGMGHVFVTIDWY